MESLRRPSVLAAAAAALLAISLIVLVARDGSDPADEAPVAEPATEDTDAGADQDDAGDGAAENGDGQAAQDGAGGDAAAEDQQDGGGQGADDDGAAAEDGAGADQGGEDGAGLGVPAAGDYGYASGGSWSLSGGGEPEEHQLPATATGTVQVEGDAWHVRLAAGERYADRFGFTLAADGGLDWASWVLERQFDRGSRNETSYSCTGDAAYYRPDEQGRVVEHDCESDAGIVSDGQVEHIGTEDVTLGDGTVVTADRLLHTYTVTGSGTTPDGVAFEVTGEGSLDLWLDPATGLRVREQRSISTTTTYETGTEQVYQEDVEFTLQSIQPS